MPAWDQLVRHILDIGRKLLLSVRSYQMWEKRSGDTVGYPGL
jgi:hypothetical protein